MPGREWLKPAWQHCQATCLGLWPGIALRQSSTSRYSSKSSRCPAENTPVERMRARPSLWQRARAALSSHAGIRFGTCVQPRPWSTSRPVQRRAGAQVMARAGVASRRAAEEIVLAGKVRVNGERVLLPQHQVVQSTDQARRPPCARAAGSVAGGALRACGRQHAPRQGSSVMSKTVFKRAGVGVELSQVLLPLRLARLMRAREGRDICCICCSHAQAVC